MSDRQTTALSRSRLPETRGGRITGLRAETESLSRTTVPSLIRLLVTVGLLVGLGYGAMLALVTFVTPEPHEIIQTIPASRLNK